ncbi:recombination factor protein RarA, partial [Pseudoalteromonas ruthenica]
DIRDAVHLAKERLMQGKRTLLFVDEVHRFNKSQQDAFLPHIEDGTFIFIGATTENPSFALNNAILSRARVYMLKALTDSEL